MALVKLFKMVRIHVKGRQEVRPFYICDIHRVVWSTTQGIAESGAVSGVYSRRIYHWVRFNGERREVQMVANDGRTYWRLVIGHTELPNPHVLF